MRSAPYLVIDHFKKADPDLVDIINCINFDEWFENDESGDDHIFKTLCRTIVGQQLAGSAAKAIFTRFEKLLNGEISPQKVLSTPPEDLRQAGLSWAKVRSVIDLSERIKNGSLVPEELVGLENEKLIEELDSVKGIGRWTAEMFLIFKMGREDIFSWGDLGLRKGLIKYLGQENISDMDLRKRVEQWSPYRTYGAIAMWHLLDNR